MPSVTTRHGVRMVLCGQPPWPPIVHDFLCREAVDPRADEIARDVLAEVRKRGDEAVIEYARRFDTPGLERDSMLIGKRELIDARSAVDSQFKRICRQAHSNIARFAKAGLRESWSISSPRGGDIGERYLPFERVGIYVPGGAAPLASTALMTVTLARIAGVPQIAVCTPADGRGQVDPHLLYAADLAGATEVYRIGGIHAVGAMAYGTATIGRVQKIAGPGGPYVTAAKRQVYGTVALDMVAGPSEIAVLADDSARPRQVAADLLSQAEHGTGAEKALLVTTSERLADATRDELAEQAATLAHREAVEKVLREGLLVAVVDTLDSGIQLCNDFAPEHLELFVHEARRWVPKVTRAGAVFAGRWSPESAGDFAAGPSHVLPTGGTAASFSGLSAQDFRRRISVVSLTRADLQQMLPIIESFGAVEGMEAHVRSARHRFDDVSADGSKQ